jgi:hypothetical protein
MQRVSLTYPRRQRRHEAGSLNWVRSCENPIQGTHMLHNLLSPAIRIEIDVGPSLLAALQKLSAQAPLTSEELFEVATITFMVARALAANKRAGAATELAPSQLSR